MKNQIDIISKQSSMLDFVINGLRKDYDSHYFNRQFI